jgi:hypothetical protein
MKKCLYERERQRERMRVERDVIWGGGGNAAWT